MVVFSPTKVAPILPTPLLAGLATDLLYKWLQPAEEEPASTRLFAFAVPGIFYLLYFINLEIAGPFIFGNRILWSIPFWAGAPVIAGMTGFLLSYLMIPPARPPEKKMELP